MRSLFVLAAFLIISYILLIGVPSTPQEVEFMPYFKALYTEATDLIDHFSLMQNPEVKVTIILGAAFFIVGIVKK